MCYLDAFFRHIQGLRQFYFSSPIPKKKELFLTACIKSEAARLISSISKTDVIYKIALTLVKKTAMKMK